MKCCVIDKIEKSLYTGKTRGVDAGVLPRIWKLIAFKFKIIQKVSNKHFEIARRGLKKQRSSIYGKVFCLHQHLITQKSKKVPFKVIFKDLSQHFILCAYCSLNKKLIVFWDKRSKIERLVVRFDCFLHTTGLPISGICSKSVVFSDNLSPYRRSFCPFDRFCQTDSLLVEFVFDSFSHT